MSKENGRAEVSKRRAERSNGRADRVFILTRRDLSAGQRIVQSCHALAELLREWSNDP
jgi:hypothetical protein